eukprot:Lankesteria_metandrocarpae@DN4026_c0_g1_i1.p1
MSVTFLICGDVEGNYSTLSTNLKHVNRKQGPFAFALCVGRFFCRKDECTPSSNTDGNPISTQHQQQRVHSTTGNCSTSTNDQQNVLNDLNGIMSYNSPDDTKNAVNDTAAGILSGDNIPLKQRHNTGATGAMCSPRNAFLPKTLRDFFENGGGFEIPVYFVDDCSSMAGRMLRKLYPAGCTFNNSNLQYLGCAGRKDIHGLKVGYCTSAGYIMPTGSPTDTNRPTGSPQRYTGHVSTVQTCLTDRSSTTVDAAVSSSSSGSSSPSRWRSVFTDESMSGYIAQLLGEDTTGTGSSTGGMCGYGGTGNQDSHDGSEGSLSDDSHQQSSIRSGINREALDILVTCDWPVDVESNLYDDERQTLADMLLNADHYGRLDLANNASTGNNNTGGATDMNYDGSPRKSEPQKSLTQLLQTVSSASVSRLAEIVEPRYHITALSGAFYQRRCYKTTTSGHACRFISLGRVCLGSQYKKDKTLKHLHALVLKPMSINQTQALPPGCTPSPYVRIVSTHAAARCLIAKRPNVSTPTCADDRCANPMTATISSPNNNSNVKRVRLSPGADQPAVKLHFGKGMSTPPLAENAGLPPWHSEERRRNSDDSTGTTGTDSTPNTAKRIVITDIHCTGDGEQYTGVDHTARGKHCTGNDGENGDPFLIADYSEGKRYIDKDATGYDVISDKDNTHFEPVQYSSNRVASPRDGGGHNVTSTATDAQGGVHEDQPRNVEHGGTDSSTGGRTGGMSNVSNNNSCVIVTNIPYQVDEDSLISILEAFGQITKFIMPKTQDGASSGRAWVQYESRDSALLAGRAHGQIESGGRRLRLALTSTFGPTQRWPRAPVTVDTSPHSDCWFCLGNPSSERQLVVSVGEYVYVALAKGGLVPQHVLIVPITHCPNAALSSKEIAKELERYVEALRCYFLEVGHDIVVFERYFPMKVTKGMHTQIQVVPIPIKLRSTASSFITSNAKRQGIILNKIDERNGNSAESSTSGRSESVVSLSDLRNFVCDPATSYFYFAMPYPADEGGENNVVDNLTKPATYEEYLFTTKGDKRMPLNFGRECAAALLSIPGRANWQNCVIPAADEAQLAWEMRERFAPFQSIVASAVQPSPAVSTQR